MYVCTYIEISSSDTESVLMSSVNTVRMNVNLKYIALCIYVHTYVCMSDTCIYMSDTFTTSN